MRQLLDALNHWRPFRAIVVGDFMLDRLVHGEASRLSADAPVPVLRVERREDQAGGAANLCLNLRAMKGEVVAIGLTGDDAEAGVLRALLEAGGVDGAGLIADPSRPTTSKQNLIGLAQARHPQKMFRVDVESTDAPDEQTEARLLAAFEAALPGADAVCIEDYNKGVCSPAMCAAIIERSREAGVPVFVDPASISDYTKYRGATAITPNRTEAERATGLPTHADASPEHNVKLARTLMDTLDLESVVLTLDRHGALLLTRDNPTPIPVPTVAREVYDVTGAGDMMLAGLAAARANGLDWVGSVELANAAAGLEVEVLGVAPIPLEQIHHEVLALHAGKGGALRTLDEAMVQVRAARSAGKKVVFTNGCFDVIHAGHVHLLEQTAALGDLLIVGLNSDESVRRLKGESRPLNVESDRARVLGALGSVDAVVLFEEDTPIRLIEAIRPDVLVKGGDYTRDGVVGADVVEAGGGRVEIIPLVDGLSTTATIERMKSRP